MVTPDPPNIFIVGRRKNDEVQLTAFLGAVFGHEPDALRRVLAGLELPYDADADWTIELERSHQQGRFDMVIECQDEALYVIESKLSAVLAPTQVRRYLEELAGDAPAGAQDRALIVVGREPVPLSPEDSDFAETKGIRLLQRTWADIAALLVPTDDRPGPLARDLRRLLMAEGLATGAAIESSDWDLLSRLPDTLARLQELVDIAAAMVSGVDRSATGRPARLEENRRVTREILVGDFTMRIAFTATPDHRALGGAPTLAIAVTKHTAPDGRDWAATVARKVPRLTVERRWVRRTEDAADLLVGGDLTAQAGLVADAAQQLLREIA